MYRQIIDELNKFLNFINVPGIPLKPDAFQGVFVKKLSNQNIIKDKRRINAGDIVSTVNQTTSILPDARECYFSLKN